jgi:hypothetical protein
MGQNYACELLTKENAEQDIKEVHLYAKAKGGSYEPIWYDPEDLMADPPRSKAAKSQPKGWKPWITSVDKAGLWKLLLVDPENTLSKLKRHKLL